VLLTVCSVSYSEHYIRLSIKLDSTGKDRKIARKTGDFEMASRLLYRVVSGR